MSEYAVSEYPNNAGRIFTFIAMPFFKEGGRKGVKEEGREGGKRGRRKERKERRKKGRRKEVKEEEIEG